MDGERDRERSRERKRISRRDFVADTGALVGGAALSSLVGRGLVASPTPAREAVPAVVLGRTGARVSRLGIGCAPFQRIGVGEVRTIMDRALELGVNYFDVAPNYGNEKTGFSEERMGSVVPGIRDRIFLVTKTEEPTYEGTWRLLRQSMERLRTDHFDLVHLHNFGHEPRFPDLELALGEKGALGALREAKKKGVVRYIGASGHLHPSRFHAVLDTGEIDVLMNAVNFVVQHTYDFVDKVWSRARREDVGLVAMKVLGGRTEKGFRLPAASYDDAVRYALSIPGVHCAVIGVKNVTELERAAAAVRGFRPLSGEESHALALEGLKLAGTKDWRVAYGSPLT